MHLAFAVLFVALLALVPLMVPWLQFVFTLAIAKGFAALGVGILLRAGLISIGHALFFAFGAYATAFLLRQVGISDFLGLVLISGLAAGLAGLVIGLFMVRYRAIFFAMLNLAVSMVFFALLAKLYSVTGGTDGLRVATPTLFGQSLGRAAFNDVLFYGALALMALSWLLVSRYLASPMGQALTAIHTNEVRLEYLGISVRNVLLTAYTISALLAGIGGSIGAIAIGHVVPEMSYWTASGHMVLVAVLGGIGGVVGPFLGAVFLELVHTFAVGYAADAWNLIVGVALLLVIFFLPKGLYGLFSTFARKRKAS